MIKKILHQRLFLCFCVGVLLAGGDSFAAVGGDSALVRPQLLSAGGLRIVWQSKLPIKANESLERLTILGDRIYALSDLSYMVSLDRSNGRIIFSRPVTEPDFAMLGLGRYEDRLFSVIGGKIVELDSESGMALESKRMRLGIICPLARNSTYFYVGCSDRRLHTLRAEDKVQIFKAAAENESMITSIYADDSFVVFGTDSGVCISITPDRPKRLWQFDAADGIVGPIVRSGEGLFFASRDTNVYRIDTVTGRLVWRYQTEAILDSSPRVTGDTVYQMIRGKGLVALAAQDGRVLWQLQDGVEMLAQRRAKSYVITKNGEMVVMDNDSGRRRYSINFAPVSQYAANVADSKIYVGDEKGNIMCIESVE